MKSATLKCICQNKRLKEVEEVEEVEEGGGKNEGGKNQSATVQLHGREV